MVEIGLSRNNSLLETKLVDPGYMRGILLAYFSVEGTQHHWEVAKIMDGVSHQDMGASKVLALSQISCEPIRDGAVRALPVDDVDIGPLGGSLDSVYVAR